jgi:hypothetical protein
MRRLPFLVLSLASLPAAGCKDRAVDVAVASGPIRAEATGRTERAATGRRGALNQRARIRLINAAPGAGRLDVVSTPGHEPLFGGVPFGTEAGFKIVTPGRNALEVRRADGQRRLLTIPNLQLGAGKSYTIVIIGRPTDRLQAITLEDAGGSEPPELLAGP